MREGVQVFWRMGPKYGMGIWKDPDEVSEWNHVKFTVDKHKVLELITKIQQQKYKVRNDQWGCFLQKDQMVMVDYTLHISQQYQVVPEKATTLLGWKNSKCSFQNLWYNSSNQ